MTAFKNLKKNPKIHKEAQKTLNTQCKLNPKAKPETSEYLALKHTTEL
jgi:hypothetical protein